MLLAILGAINALYSQGLRSGWLDNTGMPQMSAPAAPNADPELWLTSTDAFGGNTIDRVDIAAFGPHSPVPPGIPALPGPGEYYASPALAALIKSTPADELGDRFPGRLAGTIGDEALQAPGQLVIIVGHTTAQLGRATGVVTVTSIGTGSGDSPQGIVALLGIVALALLFPLLIFVSTATRLAAARREQRFAAMRLAGATPRQVSTVAAVEAAASAIAGTAVGFLLFYVFRADIAKIPFTGQPFFPGDVRLSVAEIIVVALGVPVIAISVAAVALRRVRISPLGVSRRARARRPSAWRLAPLVAGIAELAYFVAVGHPASVNGQLLAYIGGGALAVIGLVIAGPWFTMAGSALLARRATRVETLLAARRLADNPNAAFRAISGLILAVFTATVAVAVITSMADSHSLQTGGTAGKSTLMVTLTGNASQHTSPAGVTVPPSLLARLEAIPGVTDVLVTRFYAAGTADQALVDCAQLAKLPALDQCAPGAAVGIAEMVSSGITRHAWPAANVTVSQLSRLPAAGMFVATNGSAPAIERARTLLEVAYPLRASPSTVFQTQGAQLLALWQQLANVVILASLPIAGCSLAVSVVAGLTDRRRPFSLLRLAGTPVGLLRRVVAFESAVPLLVVAVISACLGIVVAELFARSQLGINLVPPGPAYYGYIIGGLLLSLAIIAATLPLLNRITGPESARSE